MSLYGQVKENNCGYFLCREIAEERQGILECVSGIPPEKAAGIRAAAKVVAAVE